MPPTDEQLAIIAQISVKLAALGHELKWREPISVGPLVTTFRFEPKGVARVRQIEGLSSDIALALSVEDVLIQRIPGEAVIGITVPNKTRSVPLWRNIVGSVHSVNTSDAVDVDAVGVAKLPLLMGVDVMGHPFIDDLTTLPHLLIAGSTGGGKSVFLRSILATLMFTRSPDEVQMILSDTKQVEFGMFTGDPHLMFDPSTSVYQTLERMEYVIDLVDQRLRECATAHVQNVHEYNQRFMLNDTKRRLPYIVLVIDELADMVTSEKKGESKLAEAKLSKIVQKSRAAGVYVIAATQRSSVDVVAGNIKANFPARLSFRLPAEHDSRTVLGQGGAEHLLTRGDMLYNSPNRQALLRLHSALASTDDLRACVEMSKHRYYQPTPKA